MSTSFSTTPTNWQGVDDEPIYNSNNLAKGSGIADFLYPEFTGFLVSDLMSRIEPDNIQENSIMAADTHISSFNGVRVVTISVSAGELIVIDNNDGYHPSYCIFAVYDTETNNLLYKKLGGTTDFQGKYLQYKKDVIIKYSIYDRIWNNGHGILKINDSNLGGFIKAQAKQGVIVRSRVRFLGILPPEDSLELIDLTQYNPTVGIFETTAQTLYRTTDYIPLTDFNYIYKPGNGMHNSFSFFRLYDADKNLLYDQKAGFMGVMDINANDISYIRVVFLATDNNFEFYSYKHINKTFDEYIDSLADHIKYMDSISPSQVGTVGIWTPNGLTTEGVAGNRYHSIYPISGIGKYFVTSEYTGLAGSSDGWYAITVLNSNMGVIAGYTDKLVGTHLTNYEINVTRDDAAYISIAISTRTTRSSLSTISNDYIDFGSIIKQTNRHESILNNSYTTILSILPPRDNLTAVDMTVGEPTVGIFNDTSQTSYRTSDYIALTGENYIYKPGNGMHVSYSFFRLYNADKNLLYDQKAGNMKLFQINKQDAAYIKVVYKVSDSNGGFEFFNTYKSTQKTFDEYIEEFSNELTYHSVLWLGTSIPEGKATVDSQFISYPQLVCRKLGWTCYNMSLGSSGIVVGTGNTFSSDRCGKDLCESSAEKVARYSETLNGPSSTEAEKQRYQQMMNWGYDKRVIPYIDGTIASCDVVVIDHSYNDRNKVAEELPDFDSASKSLILDDSNYDRHTYIGAFCFLLKKIYEVNPKIKVIVCSYLESQSNAATGKYGSECCQMNKKLADYFNMFYANMCDYNEFIMHLVPGTEDYLENFNQEYGTSYNKQNYFNEPNPNGYISKWQVYCPDGIHPHTDLTGECIKHIATNLIKILKLL